MVRFGLWSQRKWSWWQHMLGLSEWVSSEWLQCLVCQKWFHDGCFYICQNICFLYSNRNLLFNLSFCYYFYRQTQGKYMFRCTSIRAFTFIKKSLHPFVNLLKLSNGNSLCHWHPKVRWNAMKCSKKYIRIIFRTLLCGLADNNNWKLKSGFYQWLK